MARNKTWVFIFAAGLMVCLSPSAWAFLDPQPSRLEQSSVSPTCIEAEARITEAATRSASGTDQYGPTLALTNNCSDEVTINSIEFVRAGDGKPVMVAEGIQMVFHPQTRQLLFSSTGDACFPADAEQKGYAAAMCRSISFPPGKRVAFNFAYHTYFHLTGTVGSEKVEITGHLEQGAPPESQKMDTNHGPQ